MALSGLEDDLIDSLRELVKKLEEIEKNDAFIGVWGYLAIHGYHYNGPYWDVALAKAKEQLSLYDA